MELREAIRAKWTRYTAMRDQAEILRYELLTADIQSLPDILHEALCDPRQRRYALEITSQLQPELRKEFLPDLMELASFSGVDMSRAREVILSLPKPWLVASLSSVAAPILQRGSDEEYRRIIELYLLIEPGIARDLARAATAHQSEEVRAVGRDFLGDESSGN
jgi:hypothetical protein